MKKRRFFKIICCFCLLLCSTFFLTACTGGGSGGSGSSSGYDSDNPPKPDPDKQPPSSGDDSDIDIDDDGNIGGNGQVADFSDYFYGYMGMVKGNDEFEVYDDITGSKVKFNDLLDRQFDVLAQDILYRLNYVYGDLRLSKGNIRDNEGKLISYFLTDPLTNNNYNNSLAIVYNGTILENEDYNYDDGDILTSVRIDNISDYQKSLVIKQDANTNCLSFANALNFKCAILGDNMKREDDGFGSISFVNDPNKKWIQDLTSVEYSNYITQFKLYLAQLFSNSNSTNYNSLLNNIEFLGLINSYKSNICDYITKNIIGEDLVKQDNIYFDEIKLKYSGILDGESIKDIKNSYTLDDSPIFYKAYKVIINAIVDQAFENVFKNTNTSLYPYYARSSSKNGDFETKTIINSSGEEVQEMTTTGPIALDKIILKPKANSQPVAMQLQIATARKLNNGESSDDINDLGCYAHDIVVELEVSITYKSGTYVLSMPTYVPDGEDSSTLTIDSKGYIPTYIDTSDPNFDPTKVTFDPNNPNAKDPYSEQFRKPYDTNGEILPFNYVFSIYENYTDSTPKMGMYDGPTDTDSMTLFNNYYKVDEDTQSLYLDAGKNYIQFSFNIKSVKKYAGDNSTQLVDASEYKNDVVFDISLMPFTY